MPRGKETALTGKEKTAAYVTHIVAHEIGHTLGLRHNFKGSLRPVSSSVMDYLWTDDGVHVTKPGSYDHAAVKLLYGLSSALPNDPFCTDYQRSTDPDCQVWDPPANNPLEEVYGPIWRYYVDLGVIAPVDWLLPYVRAAATPAARLSAWNHLMYGVGAPLDAARAGNPQKAALADQQSRAVIKSLFLTPANGTMFAGAATDPAVAPLALAQVGANLLDVDRVRSFETRRICVDALKKQQSAAAHETLLDAQAAVAAEKQAATGSRRALLTDLEARITRAITPYYDN
jgi:hypothetical protein